MAGTVKEEAVKLHANMGKLYDAGKQAEHDRFWDAFQQNGTLANYSAGFAGYGWTAETFCPKYDVIPTNAYQMFYCFNNSKTALDMVEHAKNHGFVLDFSKATNMNNVFQGASVSRLGVIDITSCGASVSAMFANDHNMHTIDELVIKSDGSQSVGNSFIGCSGLVNLKINGVIGVTGWNFQYCVNLSKESILSIINALSEAVSGMSITLSKTAVENAFGSTTANEWTTLIGTKDGWTFSLM